MKIMNLIKWRLQEEAGSEGGDGSGATGDENNKKDPVDDYSNLWNNQGNDSDNSSGDSVQNVNVVNQNQGEVLTPQQKLSAHIDGLNLMEGFNAEDMQDPERATAMMKDVIAKTYSATMKDANQIMTQQIANLKTEMQQETQNTMQGSKNINDMNTALVYTSKPAYKPIADAALTKFLEQGKSPAEAIAEVGKYFQRLQAEVAGSLPKPPNNGLNGNQLFNDVGGNDSGDENATEWLDFINAK